MVTTSDSMLGGHVLIGRYAVTRGVLTASNGM